ncbi:hypothetical protein V1478_015993 [Vespula squamosa]|uniref:Uncharacterized protein n=1 Tax=Vespula squamosa TaxID=30214 RepID=A0ABD2A2I6_VESSQ
MAALNSKRACRVYFPPSTCRNDAWPRKTTGLSGWNRLANIPDDDDDDDDDEDDYGVEDDDDDYDYDDTTTRAQLKTIALREWYSPCSKHRRR